MPVRKPLVKMSELFLRCVAMRANAQKILKIYKILYALECVSYRIQCVN